MRAGAVLDLHLGVLRAHLEKVLSCPMEWGGWLCSEP